MFETIAPYLQNRLAIMVRQGNPKQIASLRDLGRYDVTVIMPNPETEGIAEQVVKLYERLAGGELVRRIMETKVAQGTTLSPIFIIGRRRCESCRVSPMPDRYGSRTLFQRQLGHPNDMVELPAEQNVTATTAVGP